MVVSSSPGAGLYHRPRCFDAVRWSQDNLIAAATGAQVTIFSPGSPQGSRSCTPAGLLASPPEDLFGSAEAGPRYRCQQLSQSDKAGNKSYVRAVCWSPRGLQTSGECYLTVVSSAGSVSGAQPKPQNPSLIWTSCQCCSMTGALLGSGQRQQPSLDPASRPWVGAA